MSDWSDPQDPSAQQTFEAAPQHGGPPEYGGPPQYGASPQSGGAPQYGGPPQHSASPEYGGSPQYGGPPQYGGYAGAPGQAATPAYGPSAPQHNPYQNGAYAQPYGYPPPGYPGYAATAPSQRRPGTLTASAVLGYILGGLLIFAGILLFFGANAVSSFANSFGSSAGGYAVELVVAGVADVVAAGLLIAGGVSMTGRNPSGRRLYTAGAVVVLLATVYWIMRWATRYNASPVVVYALLFAALAVVGLALAYAGEGSRWLGRASR